MNARTDNQHALTRAWLLLIGLTFISLALGKGDFSASWLPVLMALVIWLKCAIVADRFIEADQAHPLVHRIVQIFIALAPLALILVTFFGTEIGHWTALE